MVNLHTKLSKGSETRAIILDAAVQQAAVEGFDALTIGTLAAQTGMSKSGLFAHFGSKEELQIATLDEAAQRYTELVFMPAMREPRGLRRLTKLLDNWLQWTRISGLKACPMMSASAEFDDKPGAMRDAVVAHMQRLNQELMRSIQQAIDTGELSPDTDPELLAFEIFGVIASCYRSRNLFLDKNANQLAQRAFNRLLSSALAAPVTSAVRTTRPRRKTSPTA
ncbi:MAG: TetR/AcrR family transcriptional regulator [Zoogloeaceae bacterium]|nr:TetR/AcrR family transcriptional regulator [Zoogloeaceae bacterium]